ncbi:MAG: hypothetical protein KDB14_06510 [Planctomycetales bacterium]|nr:hypothetical protein [Planctomycetales bacterium]
MAQAGIFVKIADVEPRVLQSYSWDGKTVGKTVFEISVKSGPLTDAEKRLLFK